MPVEYEVNGRFTLLPADSGSARVDALNWFSSVDSAPAFNSGIVLGFELQTPAQAIRVGHRSLDGLTPLYRPIEVFEEYRTTDAPTALSNMYRGIESTVVYGSASAGVAAKGTAHATSASMTIEKSAAPDNEHAVYFGYMRYNNTVTATPGRAWFADWGVHSAPVAHQQFNGITLVVNKHFSGSPLNGPAAGMWLISNELVGAGQAGQTPAYPVEVGIGIVGQVLGGNGRAFERGIQIGQDQAAASPWGIPASKIGTGIWIGDWQNAGMWFDATTTVGPAIVMRNLTAGQSTFELRRAADTQNRFAILEGGLLYWGDGTGALDTGFYRLGANIVGTEAGDKLVANGGLGVGNSVAATEVIGKAVTRKIQVFDAAGASLGFVPVYGSIT